MNKGLKTKLLCFTLDCKDLDELARFYVKLLDWEIGFQNEEWAAIHAPGTEQGAYPYILLQKNLEYKPPVWPTEPNAQQQMAHLDIAVNDLEKAVEHAVECGATVSCKQFSDKWTTLFDPAGHPFCLCLMEKVFAVSE